MVQMKSTFPALPRTGSSQGFHVNFFLADVAQVAPSLQDVVHSVRLMVIPSLLGTTTPVFCSVSKAFLF